MSILNEAGQKELAIQLQAMLLGDNAQLKDALNKLSGQVDFSLEGLNKLAAASGQNEDIPEAVKQALELTTNQYGVVLVLKEPAMKYVQGGGTISASVLGGISAAVTSIPVVGLGLAGLLALLAAILGTYTGWMTLADKGKGVYVTVTWVQIGLAVLFPLAATTILLPVVGSIE
ncbi:MAG: hypothetical protein H6R04_1808 [Burkholderiaceae bacterium]|nr:hypothetical protein [Burkholderiaceae bacterium]